MPDYTPLLGIPIPTQTTADDVPADMMAAFQEAEKSGVPKVATVAERNAKFGSQQYAAVIVTNPPALWVKDPDGWHSVWSKPTWTEVSLLSGWTNVSSANPLRWSREGRMVSWLGVVRVPDDHAAQEWIPICNVPAEARPAGGGQRFPASTSSSSPQFGLRIESGQLQGWVYTADSAAWLGVPMTYPAE